MNPVFRATNPVPCNPVPCIPDMQRMATDVMYIIACFLYGKVHYRMVCKLFSDIKWNVCVYTQCAQACQKILERGVMNVISAVATSPDSILNLSTNFGQSLQALTLFKIHSDMSDVKHKRHDVKRKRHQDRRIYSVHSVLPHLQELEFNECDGLKEIADVCFIRLSNLRSLTIKSCRYLSGLSGLKDAQALEALVIIDCSGFDDRFDDQSENLSLLSCISLTYILLQDLYLGLMPLLPLSTRTIKVIRCSDLWDEFKLQQNYATFPNLGSLVLIK
jgi:hypothetical protein